jgi:hypothetical protein
VTADCKNESGSRSFLCMSEKDSQSSHQRTNHDHGRTNQTKHQLVYPPYHLEANSEVLVALKGLPVDPKNKGSPEEHCDEILKIQVDALKLSKFDRIAFSSSNKDSYICSLTCIYIIYFFLFLFP